MENADEERANDIAMKLFKFSAQFADPKSDPDGSTFMLGACQFCGLVLGTLSNDEREFFCGMAQHYAEKLAPVMADMVAPRGSA